MRPLLKLGIIYHIVISLLFSVSVYLLLGFSQAVACVAGCLLMAFNLVVMIWTWDRIFIKKSIALAAGVIVFKYAILGFIVYFLMARSEGQVVGFLVGLFSVVPTVVAISLHKKGLLRNSA